MYDTSKATAISNSFSIIGYIFPINDELWLPLTKDGKPCGPPTYKADAEYMVQHQDELGLKTSE